MNRTLQCNMSDQLLFFLRCSERLSKWLESKPSMYTKTLIAGLFLFLVDALSFSSPALAQQREGQPITLPRPAVEKDPSIGVLASFRKSYAKVSSPRITVFWNREFNDDIETQYESYEKVERRAKSNAASLTERTAGQSGEMETTEERGDESESSETRSGVDKRNGGTKRRILAEKIDFDVEQAFRDTLTEGGARLIDRVSIMRKAGLAGRSSDEVNVQEIETKALLESTDLVIEIEQYSDDSVARGVGFKVVCRDIRKSRILTSFRTSAEPPYRGRSYVAGPNGFEVARPPAPTPEEVGRQLAIELMDRLTDAL